jgi:hypothetical protein
MSRSMCVLGSVIRSRCAGAHRVSSACVCIVRQHGGINVIKEGGSKKNEARERERRAASTLEKRGGATRRYSQIARAISVLAHHLIASNRMQPTLPACLHSPLVQPLARAQKAFPDHAACSSASELQTWLICFSAI